MSYICIVSSEQGAVVAADSRITIDTPLPGVYFHRDNGRKVFAAGHSGEKELIWACDGVIRRGLLHYPTLARLILCNKKLSVPMRLEKAKALLCRATRRIPWTGHIPVLKRVWAEDCIFNLLYAFPKENGNGYVTGMLGIYNGQVLQDARWDRPIILENGMNMEQLTGTTVSPLAERYGQSV